MTSLPYTPWPWTPCRKPVNSHRRPNTKPIFTSSSGRRAASLPPGRRLSVRLAAAAAAAPSSSSSSAPAGVLPPHGIRPGDRFSSTNPKVAPVHHQPQQRTPALLFAWPTPPDPGQMWRSAPVPLIPQLTLAKNGQKQRWRPIENRAGASAASP